MTCSVIQFCDRNAEDISSYLEGEGSGAESPHAKVRHGTTQAPERARELMDPIRLLEEPGNPASSGKNPAKPEAAAAPPARVWNAIEAVLRDEGLIH